MERELGNGERGRKQRENEEMQRVNLSPFPHFLSISSSFPHSLSISSQPGCQAATICATLPNSHPAWPSEFLKTAHSTLSFGKLLAVEPYSAYFPLGLKLHNQIYENVARISSRSIQLCNQMHLRILFCLALGDEGIRTAAECNVNPATKSRGEI